VEPAGDLLERFVDVLAAEDDHVAAMRTCVELAAATLPHPVWEAVAHMEWGADLRDTTAWLERLLVDEQPPAAVNAYWVGVFNPMTDGEASSDFYMAGSGSWPDPEWMCSLDWWPANRYRRSPAQRAIYQLTAGARPGPAQGPAIAEVGDYALTLAHAASSTRSAVQALDAGLLLTGIHARHVTVGHDDGDWLELGTVTRNGLSLDVRLGA
jgi:hypothetical protein